MKMGITSRLFLLILCATGLAIIFLLLIMWWNINKGFYQYLGHMDQKKLMQIMDDLGKQYAQKGNWDFLKESPPRWNEGEGMPPFEPPKNRPPLPFKDKNYTPKWEKHHPEEI